MIEERRPAHLVRLLVAVAEANLPLARLVEGHVNAAHLIDLHQPDAMPENGLLGVWGADGDVPLRLNDDGLHGSKRYASGMGLLTHALVTVADNETCRLALIDVTDEARHRPEAWRMLGMRATVSGEIDLTGLAPVWIGPPGAYHREPTFVGGVWRIAALQLGGTLGLIGAARDYLAKLGRLGAEAQVARLAGPLGRAMAAYGLIEKAAVIAQGPEGAADPDRAVALSIQARLLTEDLAQDAIAAVERSVGLPHFAEGSETGRIARDLATYCRQAARDAMEQRAGRTLLNRLGPLSAIWDD
ncbi:MAG: acyl-CoA dehydrogenase [Pseudomonadota bacterium]